MPAIVLRVVISSLITTRCCKLNQCQDSPFHGQGHDYANFGDAEGVSFCQILPDLFPRNSHQNVFVLANVWSYTQSLPLPQQMTSRFWLPTSVILKSRRTVLSEWHSSSVFSSTPMSSFFKACTPEDRDVYVVEWMIFCPEIGYP